MRVERLMIPLTALCREIFELAVIHFVGTAEERKIKLLQKQLQRLVEQVDISTGRVVLTVSGKVGRADMPNSNKPYPRTIVQNSIGQLEARIASYFGVTPSPPPPPTPPLGASVFGRRRRLNKSASFGALYGMGGQSIRKTFSVGTENDAESDADRALRLARYCSYSTDAEQLKDAILMLKRYFPLEAMAVEMG